MSETVMVTLTIEQMRTALKRAEALGATRVKFGHQSRKTKRRGDRSQVEPPVGVVLAHAFVPGRGWVGA